MSNYRFFRKTWRVHLIVLLFAALSFCTCQAFAYDWTGAVAYAEQWWDGRNPEYNDYGQNDCANFVSQCLIAGGLDLSSGVTDPCGCIISCTKLNQYLVSLGAQPVTWLRGHEPPEPENFLPGDVAIFGYTDENGSLHAYAHAVIAVTGDQTHYTTSNAHSSPNNTYHLSIEKIYQANPSFDRCTFYHIPAQPVQEPTVETRPASPDEIATASTINGLISDDGGASIDERRFDWGTTPSGEGWTDWTADVTVSGNSFSYRITGLEAGTTYYFRAWAHNSAGWSKGSILSFTLPIVNAFDVIPKSVTLGDSFMISYTVADTGGPGLNRAELWRANDSGGSPGVWTEIKRNSLSGNGPYSSSFSDDPSSEGIYWYGLHVVNNAGFWSVEQDPPGPIKVTVTPLSPPVVGDFCGANFTDADGYVDVWDLMQFADHWHTRTGEGNWDAKFDLKGPGFADPDSYVDVWDLMVFADNWHKGQKL